MAVSPKIIKRRIKSVANTRKITKAMELVAGAKMRKSVQLATMSKPYAQAIELMTKTVRSLVDPRASVLLTASKAPKSSLVVVAASDRGLCGGYNAQVLKKTMEFLKGRSESFKVVTVGKRAESAVKRAGYEILASFDAISNAPSFAKTLPIGSLLSSEFLSKHVDRVFVVYMEFKSAVTQIPVVKQLLPITPEEQLTKLAESEPSPSEGEGMVRWGEGRGDDEASDASDSSILFEPSASKVLDTLLPRLLETHVYQALLEGSASEHSARMLAMRNATDNASDMLKDLSFTYNQARQANITREISEISAGKAAIE